MPTRQYSGMLEVDDERGVIYFHTDDPFVVKRFRTATILRICRLPTPIPVDTPMDIVHTFGCSWYIPNSPKEKSDV